MIEPQPLPAKQSSTDENVEKLDAALDKYEKPFGIETIGEDEVTEEARRLLAIPPSQLRSFSATQCGEASYVLGQFAFRLQIAINREQAKITWSEESIKKIIAKTINNYKGYSFEERRMQAVRDNDAAVKLEEVRVKSKLRIDRVAFLANKAEGMSKTLMGLQATKRGYRSE